MPRPPRFTGGGGAGGGSEEASLLLLLPQEYGADFCADVFLRNPDNVLSDVGGSILLAIREWLFDGRIENDI